MENKIPNIYDLLYIGKINEFEILILKNKYYASF